MPKRLGKFQLPTKLKKDDASSSPTHARFTAEPFETGFGHTIGNSLRRVLLGSIEGAAIASVKIDGVSHEFQPIDGVVEDVTEIVLNLKKVLLRHEKREDFRAVIDINKAGAVKASDIQLPAGLSLINPELVLCTLDRKRRFYAELEIKVGRSWCSAEENKASEQTIGVIPIDSLFSPVTIVRYSVENSREGQKTDYDRLVLDISTDGRITPDDALKEASAILAKHLEVFNAIAGQEIEFESKAKEEADDQNRLRNLLNMSVNEIEQKLEQLGLSLGMTGLDRLMEKKGPNA